MADGALSYCGAEVRSHDNDRFLCALFAPPDAREDLWALYAFNLEVARVRESVSDPTLGAIRIQWWRDAVAAIYDGRPPHHQVALALGEAVERGGLTRYYLDRLLDARQDDLDDEPIGTLEELDAYAAATSASLASLTLEASGVRDEALDQAAGEAATAYALAGILRAVPFHARFRHIRLPTTLIEEAGVRREELLAGQGSPALATAVEAIAERARSHLSAARRIGRMPRAALPAVLPGALADRYLARLRAARYDVFAPSREPAPITRHLRLMRTVLTRRL